MIYFIPVAFTGIRIDIVERDSNQRPPRASALCNPCTTRNAILSGNIFLYEAVAFSRKELEKPPIALALLRQKAKALKPFRKGTGSACALGAHLCYLRRHQFAEKGDSGVMSKLGPSPARRDVSVEQKDCDLLPRATGT
jgi:hypothetical protein